jgi:hypothetical protein
MTAPLSLALAIISIIFALVPGRTGLSRHRVLVGFFVANIAFALFCMEKIPGTVGSIVGWGFLVAAAFFLICEFRLWRGGSDRSS